MVPAPGRENRFGKQLFSGHMERACQVLPTWHLTEHWDRWLLSNELPGPRTWHQHLLSCWKRPGPASYNAVIQDSYSPRDLLRHYLFFGSSIATPFLLLKSHSLLLSGLFPYFALLKRIHDFQHDCMSGLGQLWAHH